MDNITHSLAGAILGQGGLKSKTRKGMAALVLGANAPDIDIFLGWVPWVPLATHRGFTHGVIGALVLMPVLVAGFLWVLDATQKRRGEAFTGKPPMNARWLLALAWIGCLTHPLLDLQTVYAVQLLSPFSTRWFHTDTLFIVDAVLWALLGAATWLSWRRERAGVAWKRPARAALAGALAYIGLNGIISAVAVDRLRQSIGGVPDHVVASPKPLAFWQRDMIWVTDARYAWGLYDPFSSPSFAAVRTGVRANMDSPLIAKAARADPSIAKFLRWSIMPVARIEWQACTANVTFNDARFDDPRVRARFEHSVSLPIAGEGCR